jgi:DNA topoisomerase-1
VTERLATVEPAMVDDVLLEAIDEAAERLGNTRAVCRASYVHPEVLDAARGGQLQDVWSQVRGRRHLRRAEVALLEVIGAGR